MKDNSKMVRVMVKVFIIIRMVTNMMVIGLMIRNMDMECITGQMVISLKESGEMAKEME
jgi:hypothetical protein